MSDDLDIDADLPVAGLAPTPEERPHYHNVRVSPSAGPAFDYSLVVPRGWYKQPDVPGQPPPLGAGRFVALGIFSPTENMIPPVLISAGVTLPVSRAPVLEHLRRYCLDEGFDLLAARISDWLGGQAVEALALQATFKMRLMMLEDGGRLFVLSGLAPAALYSKYVRDLSLGLVTFALDRPLGPTLPIQ